MLGADANTNSSAIVFTPLRSLPFGTADHYRDFRVTVNIFPVSPDLSLPLFSTYALRVFQRVCPQSFLFPHTMSFPAQEPAFLTGSLACLHNTSDFTQHLLYEAKVRLMIINSIQRSQKQAYFQSYLTLLGYELI